MGNSRRRAAEFRSPQLALRNASKAIPCPSQMEIAKVNPYRVGEKSEFVELGAEDVEAMKGASVKGKVRCVLGFLRGESRLVINKQGRGRGAIAKCLPFDRGKFG